MKRWIFSLALIFSVSIQDTSVQNMVAHDHEDAPRVFESSEAGYLPAETVPTGHLSVVGMKITGFEGSSLKKLEDAFRVLELAVNSEEFKERVINFKNSRGERAFASNKGFSNEEIYAQFMEGRETLQQDTPGEMNFFLKLYNRSWSKVIGYTSPDTNTININWKFFKNFKPSDVASNLAHEWTHKIGFGHASAKEHDSAPYAIGYIVKDIASRLQVNELH